MPTWPKASVWLTGVTQSMVAVATRLSTQPVSPQRCRIAMIASAPAIVQPTSTTACGTAASGTASTAANGG